MYRNVMHRPYRSALLVLSGALFILHRTHGGASGFDYNTPEDELLEEYDFIIVGGGPAGSRLFEKLTNATLCGSSYRVLLLEAGGNPPLWTDVPLYYGLTGSPGYDNVMWWFPHKSNGLHNLGSGKPTVFGGKVLGGGSTFNGAAYQRGCAADYDRIEPETQCKGWEYKDVLKALKHDENNRDPQIRDNGHHGKKGTLCVNSLLLANGETGGYHAWKNAIESQGMQYADPQDGTCHGKGYHFQAAYCHGIRYSAVTAFITPFFQARRNQMHIKLNTLATKLVMDQSGTMPRVVGVETADAITAKRGNIFRAKREVILTGGALKTPQLMMVSGIGPAKHLQSKGIKPIVDLPGVGRNLHNHPGISSFYIKNVPKTWLPNRTCEDVEAYFRGPSGSLISSSVNMAGVAYRQLDRIDMHRPLDDEVLRHNFADVEYTLSGSKGFGGPWLAVDPKIKEEYLGPLKNEDFLTVNVYQMHQKSRGFVELNSTSMADAPHVYFNYFSEKTDLDTLAVGAMKIVEMLRSPAFVNLGIELYERPFPKCKEHAFGTLEYFRCLVMHTTHANFHYAGTTKMGCNRRTDPNAVVDGRCRVYDVEGLRVADTSITHAMPQGHSMAYAYLTGARCGDFISQDHYRAKGNEGGFIPAASVRNNLDYATAASVPFTRQIQ
ncbi:glucose dehydrogenase-like [Tropilaelaps mercedesae]|uniref:Glucose dehydrogenase-like n=1 Tax=Tropilaelaps mercedesae TaxID=418985 RepID=A0A1V9Y0H3_9ACAR|nr:glucose dehydrogenase-like [Tropilaelaps mercedesae]